MEIESKSIFIVILSFTKNIPLQLTKEVTNASIFILDPTVEAVKPLWSFLSGGRILTVRGRNLHTVETPYITALDKR